jgi:hypothetical protein
MKFLRVLFVSCLLLLTACAAPAASPTSPPATPLPETPTVSPPVNVTAEIPAETPAETGFSAVSLPSENFRIGTRISVQVGEGVQRSVNAHYAYVMTPVLSREVRRAVQGPDLILYRSIQGTWEGFGQFDWAHINATETMFEHHQGERILTLWNSWLMNTDDLVAADAPDAMNHWVNYYAVTASEQVYEYDYDGLFIDSASHQLHPSAVRGKMPDDYDPDDWYRGRVESLAFIKSYLPDKSVIFNGLHSRGGAENSLANTDGGMWEVFAFKPQTGEYQGIAAWLEVMELVSAHNAEKQIVLVLKEQPDLNHDLQKRIFTVASYLLVSNENVILSMTDLGHINSSLPLYYPEYSVDLGSPLSDFTYSEAESLAIRKFEHGIVLVNPSESETAVFETNNPYLSVQPIGGGEVAEDGSWDGSVEYELIATESIELPPLSGLLLLET